MKKTRKFLALGLSFVMMLGLCLTAGTAYAAGDVASKEVTTAEEFIAAANDPNIDVIEIADSISINTSIEGDDGFGQITNKTIKDVRTTKTNGWQDNLLNIVSGGKVTFNAVNFVANENTRNLLSINGDAEVTLTGITYDHTRAYAGAPIVVKDKASILVQEGQVLNLGKNSWYGVNVDGHASADFASANIECHTSDENNTQSVVCLDSIDVDVRGLSYSQVTTAADGGANSTQVAYVLADDLADFIMAKTAVNADVKAVYVTEEIPLTKTLTLSEPMTIECVGNLSAFVAKGFDSKDNVVTVTSKDVQLNNVKIVTDESTKSGLHIYGGEVTATHLTVDNRNTDGGAAVVLNGGQLDLNGTTTFQLGENSWGGINIDNRSNVDPVLNIANNATINVISPDESVGLYYVDADKQDSILLENVVNLPETVTVTMNNKEVTVNNGVITEPTQSTDPTTPGEDSKPEQETITITMKAIVDGKEVNLEELGLTLEDTQIKGITKGSVLSEADLKELDSMKDGFKFEGYTFKGFFLDVEGTEALKANVPFNADTTIYMIWGKNIDVTVTPNPEDTDKPVQDTTNKPEQKPAESDKTVKTDDNSQTILYGLMLSLSVVGTGIVVLNKKKEKLLNK